jgi:hypothetical protein
MNERIQAIVEETRKLTPGERLELFELIRIEFSVESDGALDRGALDQTEAAWLKEIEDRVSQAASGETKLVDFADVLSRAKSLIR